MCNRAQAYSQDKVKAAMAEANAKPGVTAVPATALETEPGVSKGGLVVGDVNSYKKRKGMMSVRDMLVDVLLPIIVILIGAPPQVRAGC